MAYSEKLADRVRTALAGRKAIEEKKMMGGICFMVHGKMCVGIDKNDLMVRCDPEMADALLAKRGVRHFDLTGKPMKGWLLVSPEGMSNKKDLNYWIGLALDFNKKAKASKKRS